MQKVSIITVVKDHETGLEATIKSLLNQRYSNWEMIIVVGRSSDKTYAVAARYVNSDIRISVLSQVSNGIYAAMNEGLEAVSGEFTWFMNAGDIFATTEVLGLAVGNLSRSDAALLIGGYSIISDYADQSYSFRERNVTKLNIAFGRRMGCHQSMMFRTRHVMELGGFDLRYSLASDFDLILRLLWNTKAKRLSTVFAKIEPGGRADQHINIVHKEKHKIRKELFGRIEITILSLAWTWLARIKIYTKNKFRK